MVDCNISEKKGKEETLYSTLRVHAPQPPTIKLHSLCMEGIEKSQSISNAAHLYEVRTRQPQNVRASEVSEHLAELVEAVSHQPSHGVTGSAARV